MTWLTNIGTAGGQVARGAAVAMLTCGLLSACSSNSTSPSTSTTLVGVVANATESGSLTITIATGTLALAPPAGSKVRVFSVVTPAYASAASVVNATGTLAIQGGATITLTGTYDTGTHTLSLSGGGYTFTGTYANGVLSGTFTNPTGGAGGFTTQSGSTTSVVAYCGTFTGSDMGYWNLTVNLTTLVATGIHVSTVGQGTGLLTGTVSGSSISGTSVEPQGVGGTFAGTFSGTNQSTLSGTWSGSGGVGDHGTFTGARCS